MKRKQFSEKPEMSSEYSAPQVRMHARDMLLDMGELLARGASIKSKISAIALATRLSAGRVKRYVYEEVQRVPADEYLTIQAWSQRLKARLGALEQQYDQARAAILAEDPSDTALASLVPPRLSPEADRPENQDRRLLVAQEIESRRRFGWGGR